MSPHACIFYSKFFYIIIIITATLPTAGFRSIRERSRDCFIIFIIIIIVYLLRTTQIENSGQTLSGEFLPLLFCEIVIKIYRYVL